MIATVQLSAVDYSFQIKYFVRLLSVGKGGGGGGREGNGQINEESVYFFVRFCDTSGQSGRNYVQEFAEIFQLFVLWGISERLLMAR